MHPSQGRRRLRTGAAAEPLVVRIAGRRHEPPALPEPDVADVRARSLRLRYWTLFAELARQALVARLLRGIDRHGQPFAALVNPRRDGSSGPPLAPRGAASRTVRLLRARADAEGATLFWDAGTGPTAWGVILNYHARGIRSRLGLRVRDAGGLPEPVLRAIAERAQLLFAPVLAPTPQRRPLPPPAAARPRPRPNLVLASAPAAPPPAPVQAGMGPYPDEEPIPPDAPLPARAAPNGTPKHDREIVAKVHYGNVSGSIMTGLVDDGLAIPIDGGKYVYVADVSPGGGFVQMLFLLTASEPAPAAMSAKSKGVAVRPITYRLVHAVRLLPGSNPVEVSLANLRTPHMAGLVLGIYKGLSEEAQLKFEAALKEFVFHTVVPTAAAAEAAARGDYEEMAINLTFDALDSVPVLGLIGGAVRAVRILGTQSAVGVSYVLKGWRKGVGFEIVAKNGDVVGYFGEAQMRLMGVPAGDIGKLKARMAGSPMGKNAPTYEILQNWIREYQDTFGKNFHPEDVTDVIQMIKSHPGPKGQTSYYTVKQVPGHPLEVSESRGNIAQVSENTRRWILMEEFLHCRVREEGFFKAEIEAVKGALPKKKKPPGFKGYPLNIHRDVAAEEIVIKQHILDNFAHWLTENDRIFIEKQIDILKQWGLLYDY